ncbi:flagellar export chaperone FliS [Nocardioides sp. Kera G14]|uniref:flagellar export chaperone FliS n=1 Tax=Nocardioides sp. Kera G14 TaxID=2884264 RepID=UPI001D116633|nr:flagellar export chaperone FliS [Nocardioides sp. Kera G14]UDY24085.1 flagellar export chaperone FliS [Nocardioides sp. Kera G14]
MTTMRDPRAAYQNASVNTASPLRLFVMLFDRLVLDCERGLRAVQAGNRQEANTHFQHGQRIVFHLISTHEVDEMPAGRQLLALYDWISRQLIKANVEQDEKAAAEALLRSSELADTFKQAALLGAVAS